MVLHKKQLRYYYWLVLEFSKKNARLILLSFLLSVFGIISIVSLTPFLVNFTTIKKEVIGISTVYPVDKVPASILSKLSNGLVFVNEKGEVIPILIDSWKIADKGKEYRFYLKKNLFWNDGKAFTAKDITYKFPDIEMRVVNDYEIAFKLKKALPIFPNYLAQPLIKPPLTGVAGLYKVERSKIQNGNVIELYLTPNKSNFPILVYKFYKSEIEMINAYKLGQITQMDVTKKSVADTFISWRNTEISKTVDYSQLITLFFNLNNQKFFLKEQKDLRQAIAMALSQKNFSELGQLANGPIPPLSWAHSSQIRQVQPNPDFMDKVLKANTDSKKIAMTLSTFDETLDIADKVKESLDGTNIDLDIKVIYDKPDTFDMFLLPWPVPQDPDQYYMWHSTQKLNITGYNSNKIDKLLEDGRDTASTEERIKIYNNFQKTIVDDVPAYFLYYPYIYTIKRK